VSNTTIFHPCTEQKSFELYSRLLWQQKCGKGREQRANCKYGTYLLNTTSASYRSGMETWAKLFMGFWSVAMPLKLKQQKSSKNLGWHRKSNRLEWEGTCQQFFLYFAVEDFFSISTGSSAT